VLKGPGLRHIRAFCRSSAGHLRSLSGSNSRAGAAGSRRGPLRAASGRREATRWSVSPRPITCPTGVRAVHLGRWAVRSAHDGATWWGGQLAMTCTSSVRVVAWGRWAVRPGHGLAANARSASAPPPSLPSSKLPVTPASRSPPEAEAAGHRGAPLSSRVW